MRILSSHDAKTYEILKSHADNIPIRPSGELRLHEDPLTLRPETIAVKTWRLSVASLFSTGMLRLLVDSGGKSLEHPNPMYALDKRCLEMIVCQVIEEEYAIERHRRMGKVDEHASQVLSLASKFGNNWIDSHTLGMAIKALIPDIKRSQLKEAYKRLAEDGDLEIIGNRFSAKYRFPKASPVQEAKTNEDQELLDGLETKIKAVKGRLQELEYETNAQWIALERLEGAYERLAKANDARQKAKEILAKTPI